MWCPCSNFSKIVTLHDFKSGLIFIFIFLKKSELKSIFRTRLDRHEYRKSFVHLDRVFPIHARLDKNEHTIRVLSIKQYITQQL